MVQAFTADTPEQRLDIRMLPRTSGGQSPLLRCPCAASAAERQRRNPITVAVEIPRGLAPWNCFHDLPGRPCNGWMHSDVDMYETSSLMGQDEQNKQYFVGDRRHDKEIQGHQIRRVVLEESLPRR